MFLRLSYTMGVLSAYLLPVFTVFGIFSNLHIIYIFMVRMPRRTRQLVYLSAIAAADIVNLIFSSVLFMIPSKGIPFATGGQYYFFILSIGQPTCIGYRIASTFTATFAINLLILASLDRCLAVYFPFKFIQMSVQGAWMLITLTAGITIMEIIPIAATMQGYIFSKDGTIQCSMASTNPTTKWVIQIYRQLFCNCGLMQLLLICLINLILFCKIVETGALRKKIRSITKNSSKEISACKLILVMSLIFAVVNFPQVITLQVAFLMPPTTSSDVIRLIYNINDISWIFFLFQESVNWVIYFFRMNNFRRHVLQSLRVKSTDAPREYSQSIVIVNA